MKKKIKDLTSEEISKVCDKYDKCLDCPLCGGGLYYYCETQTGIKNEKEIIRASENIIKQLEATLELEIEVEDEL